MSKITKKSKSSATKPTVAVAAPASTATSSPPPSPLSVKAEAPRLAQAPKASQVSLQLVKPGAKRVCVAGSFNGWKPEATPLTPHSDGHWSGDLTVKPGRHEYLFVVDGQWLPDPNAKESVANPFGGKNSVLIVSE